MQKQAKKRAMNRVIFRVDGNSTIGVGHLTRCLALAEYLTEHFEIKFILKKGEKSLIDLIKKSGFKHEGFSAHLTLEDEVLKYKEWGDNGDIVVLDGYHFTFNYMTKLKERCRKLVCIDDNADRKYDADLIINHNAHALQLKYEATPDTKFLLGSDYLLLRKAFLEEGTDKPQAPSVERIVICLGGADPKNYTLNFLRFIETCSQKYFVDTVIGMSNPNRAILKRFVTYSVKNHRLHTHLDAHQMCALFRSSDILLTTPSIVAWEAMAIGTPLIVGISAHNQVKTADLIHSAGHGINLGWLFNCSQDGLETALNRLGEDPGLRRQMVMRQKLLVDKKSPGRLLRAFQEL